MGWNYTHIIQYPQRQAPAQMATSLLGKLADSKAFAGIYGLDAYINHFDYFIYRDGFADHQSQRLLKRWWDKPLDVGQPEAAVTLLNLFEDERFAFELSLGITRWTDQEADANGETQFALEDRSTQLSFYGRKFQGYFFSERLDTGVVYDARDSRRYQPSLYGEYALQNLQRLRQEIAFFAQSGATSIFGLDLNQKDDPRYWSSVYHADVLEFWGDLRRMIPDQPVQTPEQTEVATGQLQQAATGLQDILVESIGQGFLIQNQKGTEGSLAQFYAALQKLDQA